MWPKRADITWTGRRRVLADVARAADPVGLGEQVASLQAGRGGRRGRGEEDWRSAGSAVDELELLARRAGLERA
jgi:hypothetical protein